MRRHGCDRRGEATELHGIEQNRIGKEGLPTEKQRNRRDVMSQARAKPRKEQKRKGEARPGEAVKREAKEL